MVAWVMEFPIIDLLNPEESEQWILEHFPRRAEVRLVSSTR